MEKNKKTVIFGTLFVIVVIVTIVSLLNWREHRLHPVEDHVIQPVADTIVHDPQVQIEDMAHAEDTLYVDELIIDQPDTTMDSLSVVDFILSNSGVDTIRIDTNNMIDHFTLE